VRKTTTNRNSETFVLISALAEAALRDNTPEDNKTANQEMVIITFFVEKISRRSS